MVTGVFIIVHGGVDDGVGGVVIVVFVVGLSQDIFPFGGREVHRLLIKRTKQKPGVYLESLEPAMDTAGLEIVNVYHQVMGDDYVPVITSGNDWPYHARKSKHYENKAMDFRIKYIPIEQRREIVRLAEERLKPRFRIIWERGEAEHLHLEMSE